MPWNNETFVYIRDASVLNFSPKMIQILIAIVKIKLIFLLINIEHPNGDVS